MKRKLDALLHGPSHAKMPISTKIQLDPRERRLRNLLVDVARSIDGPQPVVLRWAGGWVRDKLLGSASHDIDVAINAMTGGQFTAHLREHCQKPDVIAAHGLADGDIGSPHTVARQPDKSKHLETAILRLFGLDLDFVNLRKETYADDSRNPQMEFGTPEEDALRRDATINALFYNLNTEEVEDFTGGLADMEKRIIRTPLEPLQTFKDDPLRVLRLVRFSSRLDFSIHEGTRRFMADEGVLEALKIKISRERVGQELEKMLQGRITRCRNFHLTALTCLSEQTSILGWHCSSLMTLVYTMRYSQTLHAQIYSNRTSPDGPLPTMVLMTSCRRRPQAPLPPPSYTQTSTAGSRGTSPP